MLSAEALLAVSELISDWREASEAAALLTSSEMAWALLRMLEATLATTCSPLVTLKALEFTWNWVGTVISQEA